MAFNATAFKTGNPFGGARPSLFQVQLSIPASIRTNLRAEVATKLASFRVRTSQLPGRTISSSEIPYMGRTIKYNGAPTFEDWETTIYEDEDFSCHEMITTWMNSINSASGNLMGIAALPTSVNPLSGYFADLKVTVASKAGAPIKQVTMFNAWPTVLGSVELDWANNDEILNFPVTWAYSHWIPSGIGSDAVKAVTMGKIDPQVVAPLAAGTYGMITDKLATQ